MLVEKIQLNVGERVVRYVRRHWFILATQLALPVVLAILPYAVYALVASPSFPLTLPNLAPYMPMLIFGYAAWLLLLWMLAFNIWTHHYLDILVLTNERIILIDQRGLFHRTVSSFRLERMQDMYVEVHGIIATFLDFGTVHAETASHSEEEFRAYGMPRPRELKAEILKAADGMIDEYRDRSRDTSGAV